MATFAGEITLGSGAIVGGPSRIPARHERVKQLHLPDDSPEVMDLNPQRFAYNLVYVQNYSTNTPTVYAGEVVDKLSYSFDWFEKFHVEPRFFEFGNVLTTQQVAVNVYSSYRRETHTWDAFINNAGAGVELLNMPSLPAVFGPQTGTEGMVLEVSPSGPPVVDTTLDFIFDTMTLSPIITLNRLVLFDLPPELPYSEVLVFLTQIMAHKDGTEQRIALRKNPRQYFRWDFVLDAARERSRIHNLLFDWQSRVFGVPMWHEATFSNAVITAADLTITVRSTAFADYRVGGLVLIYKDSTTFDVMEIAAAGITSTTLTFTNPVQNSYALNTKVMPLRSGIIRVEEHGERFASDAARLQLTFQVLDNDANLGSTTGWTVYNSKVVLDDINSLNGQGSKGESFLMDVVTTDNATGVPVFSTPWDKGKHRTEKTFWTNTRALLWKVRQLVHSLRGRQTSFYLPSFGQDLVPVANLQNATNTLTISNVGYANYIRQRVPKDRIRVVFVNPATTPLYRRITGSSEIDANSELLTLDANWPTTYTPSQVLRIEYVQLCRFDSDVIRIDYLEGDKTARITSPVLTVFDE